MGRQVALYLAEHGAGAVVVNDFHAERAESAAAAEAAGAKAMPLAFDVSDFDAVGAAFAEAQNAFGGVDILVNNAGITQPLKIMVRFGNPIPPNGFAGWRPISMGF